MHYARKGIVTAEMEYIAIRENQLISERGVTYALQHDLRSLLVILSEDKGHVGEFLQISHNLQ